MHNAKMKQAKENKIKTWKFVREFKNLLKKGVFDVFYGELSMEAKNLYGSEDEKNSAVFNSALFRVADHVIDKIVLENDTL